MIAPEKSLRRNYKYGKYKDISFSSFTLVTGVPFLAGVYVPENMLAGLIGIFVGVIITLSLLLYVYIKIGSKPRVILNNLPEELKPFLEMQTKYLTFANPSSKLLPKIREILAKKDPKKISVDIISYRFAYDGYSKDDEWFKALAKILKEGGKIRLIGGKPSGKNLEGLKELKSLGAEIRFLSEPPVTHLFACYENSKPIFIWFEGDHRDNVAMAVVYTDNPTEEYGKLAKEYFNKLWEMGEQID